MKMLDDIQEIKEYIESCPQKRFSSDITVSKEMLLEYLMELENDIPGEVGRCEKIAKNEAAIIDAANKKAEEIKAKAAEEAADSSSEHEVFKIAMQRGDEVVASANKKAYAIISDADAKAGAMLKSTSEQTIALLERANQAISDANAAKEILDQVFEDLNRTNEASEKTLAWAKEHYTPAKLKKTVKEVTAAEVRAADNTKPAAKPAEKKTEGKAEDAAKVQQDAKTEEKAKAAFQKFASGSEKIVKESAAQDNKVPTKNSEEKKTAEPAKENAPATGAKTAEAKPAEKTAPADGAKSASSPTLYKEAEGPKTNK